MIKKTLMQQEIFSEPEMIQRTIDTNKETVVKIAKYVRENKIKTFVTIARGTSNNAATFFSFACPIFTGIPVSQFHPSVTTVYDADVDLSNTCMLVISQSGMSTDTLLAMRAAKKNGSTIIGVTNNLDSPVAKEASFHLYLNVEEEKSVAATKTYIAQLVVLSMLVESLSNKKFKTVIPNMPMHIANVIKKSDEILKVAISISDLDNFLLISRGLMQATCDEAALKMTECCCLFTKSFSVANFMHGPFVLVDKGSNIILLAPSGLHTNNFIDFAKMVVSKQANLIAITDIEEIINISSHSIKMPTLDEISSVVAYGTLVSILALYIGTQKGLDVDNPRGLNKVTVTI